MTFKPAAIAQSLLPWYDLHRRTLPWRALPGKKVDPYRVWLSEIMLQQTVAATVIPYFLRFVARWPTVRELAAAPLDDVLTEWAGLGYYARARNLHRCAKEIVGRFGGVVPSDKEHLLSLPGIGLYTAGAICAIAFDRPELAMDGNVERVTARLANLEDPLPAARPRLRAIATEMVPPIRAGDFAQALMDLGATVCIPAKPKCLFCPLAAYCEAFQRGDPGRLPMKAAKRTKPTRYGCVYWTVDADGLVLVRRRPQTGLLGGMIEFPSSEWTSDQDDRQEAVYQHPLIQVPGVVRHAFTHFLLELTIVATRLTVKAPDVDGFWVHPDKFDTIALPNVMRKVAVHATGHFVRGSPLLPGDEHADML